MTHNDDLMGGLPCTSLGRLLARWIDRRTDRELQLIVAGATLALTAAWVVLLAVATVCWPFAHT